MLKFKAVFAEFILTNKCSPS